MSWEHWLFLAAAVAGLVAVGYAAMRQESSSSTAKPTKQQEPSFRRPPDKTGKTSADSDSSAASDSPPPTAMREGKPLPRPPPPQGTLAVDKFMPPELPPVPEDLLPLEMCYAIALYGRRSMSPLAFDELEKAMAGVRQQRRYVLGFDSAAGQWRLSPEMECRDWFFASPLADRGGALTSGHLRKMEEKTRVFSQKWRLHPLFPPPHKALEDAAHIDRFCAAVDMLVELRLAGDRQPAARIDEVMGLAGMPADGNGRYIRRVHSETWFSGKLLPTPAVGGRQVLILEMDAPNVSNPPAAFDDMLKTAARAAQMLDARLTDPRGAEVDSARAAEMRRQLALLASQMREFGAAPGGEVARLIFS